MSGIFFKKVDSDDYQFLYELLSQRDPLANISHKKMPTFREHQKFINSKPYKIWYIILKKNKKIGTVYLSKQNEIGISFLKDFQSKGSGTYALKFLIEKHPERRYLANINPKNKKSMKFFTKHNFKLIQHTYEYIPNEEEQNKTV